jgi:hypothetical protein
MQIDLAKTKKAAVETAVILSILAVLFGFIGAALYQLDPSLAGAWHLSALTVFFLVALVRVHRWLQDYY